MKNPLPKQSESKLFVLSVTINDPARSGVACLMKRLTDHPCSVSAPIRPDIASHRTTPHCHRYSLSRKKGEKTNIEKYFENTGHSGATVELF
jgi:hypothetical protein